MSKQAKRIFRIMDSLTRRRDQLIRESHANLKLANAPSGWIKDSERADLRAKARRADASLWHIHQMFNRLNVRWHYVAAERNQRAAVRAAFQRAPTTWRELEKQVALLSGWVLYRTRSGAWFVAVNQLDHAIMPTTTRPTMGDALEDLPRYTDLRGHDFDGLVAHWRALPDVQALVLACTVDALDLLPYRVLMAVAAAQEIDASAVPPEPVPSGARAS